MNTVCRQYCFLFLEHFCFLIYPWVQVIPNVTLSNVTSANNLLLKSYFKNYIVELHVLYVLNMHINIHVNKLLFIIQSINLLWWAFLQCWAGLPSAVLGLSVLGKGVETNLTAIHFGPTCAQTIPRLPRTSFTCP